MSEHIENENDEPISDILNQRLTKLKELKDAGVEIYPNRFKRDYTIQEIMEKYFQNEEVHSEDSITLAGRVMGKRPMGKAGFINIQDFSGKIQVYSNNKLLDDKQYFLFENIDIGDIVGIMGTPFRTKTGEASIRGVSITNLAKNLYPLPVVKEKDDQTFDAFSDVETRYRRRYLDLAVNKNVRDTFVMRSRIITVIREFFQAKGFIEVETPMMQSVASGAAARPFETFHNTLNMPLFLRIAPELYLKRLIAGGFEKVFELNRNFRNEGISIKHNPEFTMMEVYQAYADYHDMMDLTEEMFNKLTTDILKTTEIEYGEHKISLKTPWPRKRYLDIIKEKTGIDFYPYLVHDQPDIESARVAAHSVGIETGKLHTFWEIIDEIFSRRVEPELIQPVFITDFPMAMSPLAKNIPGNPHLVERFEPYIAGREMGNAFSELNDPQEQYNRFMQQLDMKKEGQDETIQMDEDFIDVLKMGMPPTGGLGIGIDRLVMLLTNSPSIKDVILFPLLRKR